MCVRVEEEKLTPMTDQDRQHPTYESPVPFEEDRSGVVAVYCSDGRFGEQCDDLLHHALGLPTYDRLVIPGGAACLAGYVAAHREESVLLSQMEFLIEAHALHQVVLIAHQDCAFYTSRLRISQLNLLARQTEDLAKAAVRVQDLGRHLVVTAFFAHVDGDVVDFEQLR